MQPSMNLRFTSQEPVYITFKDHKKRSGGRYIARYRKVNFDRCDCDTPDFSLREVSMECQEELGFNGNIERLFSLLWDDGGQNEKISDYVISLADNKGEYVAVKIVDVND
ncbi:hypothetical protein ACYZT2_04850 [Pseudomonas sp. MDT1-85]